MEKNLSLSSKYETSFEAVVPFFLFPFPPPKKLPSSIAVKYYLHFSSLFFWEIARVNPEKKNERGLHSQLRSLTSSILLLLFRIDIFAYLSSFLCFLPWIFQLGFYCSGKTLERFKSADGFFVFPSLLHAKIKKIFAKTVAVVLLDLEERLSSKLGTIEAIQKEALQKIRTH